MKTKYYLMMAAASLLMSNCSQEETPSQSQAGSNTLTATIEGSSRSAVTDGGVFSWTSGDEISVWVGNKYDTYTFDATTTNSFNAPENAGIPTGYAIYPAHTNHGDGNLSNGGLPTVMLESSYQYGSTNAPMLAKIDGSTLAFKHLGGLMRFVVKDVPNSTTSFKFTANKKITGDFAIETIDGENVIKAADNGEGTNEITIHYEIGEIKDMTFYVPLPVGEYSGYTVSVGEKSHTTDAAVVNTINRGTLLLMPTFTYTDTGLEKSTDNVVMMNAGEEVSLDVNGGEEVVVEITEGATATLNLTAPEGTTDGTVSISDGSAEGTESTASAGTLNVAAENVANLNINAPTLTVNLTSGTYGTVEALTAEQTLIIGEGVSIEKLVLKGGNVKLEGDLELTCPLQVAIATTIDLNGYTIKPKGTGMSKVQNTSDALILVSRGGGLTITDSSAEGKGRVDTGNNESIMGAIKMTDGQDEGNADAKLTINGGNIKGYNYGIMGNGNRNGTAITITGGIIEAGYCAEDNTGIFHPQSGTLNISGGNLTGYMSAVEMRSGTLTISGGIFESTGSPADATANGNGNTITGAAIAVSQHITNQELSVTISNGTFNGVYALYEEDKQDDNVSGISMSVIGGTFNGSVFTENCKTAITGGTFSDPSACYYLGTGANVTVDMEADYKGAGFKTQSGQTVALNIASGKTYTVTAPLVGSTGTQTLGFQFLQGSTVTIGGSGTITSSEAKMLINNYSNLTLNGITLAPSIPTTMNGQTYYVLSNNCGEVNIEDGTTITAPTGNTDQVVYAFDVCKYASYPSVTVNVKGGTIIGDVEYTGTEGDKQHLNISGGTITGDLVVADDYKNASWTGVSIIGGGQEGEGWDAYQPIDSAKLIGKWSCQYRGYDIKSDGTFDQYFINGKEDEPLRNEKWTLIGRILELTQVGDDNDDPEYRYIVSLTDTELKWDSVVIDENGNFEVENDIEEYTRVESFE